MNILLYGSKEFASTVGELVRHCGHQLCGLVDDYNTGNGIIGSFDSIKHTHPYSEYGFAIAIGYNNIKARWTAWEKIQTAGYSTPVLIHPNAYIADTVRVGDGAMIMAGAIVDVRVEIGVLNVLWPGVCINHDTKIGANTFVSPGATICGAVNVGAHSFIGAGAVIVDHCTVPESSYIKMLARYA